MTISIKHGVDISNLKAPMSIAHSIVTEVYRDAGKPCRITCGRDGEHRGLPHYLGYALDYGIRGLTQGLLQSMLRDLQAALGPQFDVVGESDHIHIEFDPR